MRKLSALFAVAGLLVLAVTLSARAQTPGRSMDASSGPRAAGSNSPWYPSLEAFEHYNSGRSHVFSMARFGGSLHGRNRVALLKSAGGAYPSGYNMSYLNARAAFIQGGSYGDDAGSIGPYVAKVNPNTLKPEWYTQLRNTKKHDEWDYPGAMAIMDDGFIYVVSGYWIWKVNPANGKVVKTLELPTMVHMRNNYPVVPATYSSTLTNDAKNTAYNGINALPDGTIVVKSLYRQDGCTKNGPQAILTCPETGNVPASILATVNPKTMRMIDKVTLPAFAGARPSITRYHGVDYVYLVERYSNADHPVRYAVKNGHLSVDNSWTPAPVPYSNQTTGGSLIVMNNWIVGATNSVPASAPLTVFAINQGDAKKAFYLQPYANDRIPPLLRVAFSSAGPGGAKAVSWADMSLEADSETGLFYGVETLARKVAAFRLTTSGIKIVWEKNDTTTEWATLIGPRNHRVWVGTDIPRNQIPGKNTTERIVVRDAATGRELARSALVPQMTQGSAIQPGYCGSVFFPTGTGTLIKATPHPVGQPPRARCARPKPVPPPTSGLG
jgi:hypothetical protein